MDCDGTHDWVLIYDPPEGNRAGKRRTALCFLCGATKDEESE